MPNFFKGRFGLVYLFFLTFVALAALTRSILAISSWNMIDADAGSFALAFVTGLLMDVITASYLAIPLVLYALLVPNKIYHHRLHKLLIYPFFLVVIYSLIFSGVSEWFFWEEFSSRFNFIAVDYLVYTTELIGNIRESYPLNTILSIILVASIILTLLLLPALHQVHSEIQSFRTRLRQAAQFLLIPLLAFIFVNLSLSHISSNRYLNELAGNGIYNFFSAFRNNELDYNSYYRTEDEAKLWPRLRQLLAQDNARYISDKVDNITRHISANGPEKPLNVIWITVESLSASYLGFFGNEQGLSPELDKLSRDSLNFTRLYATGTRTVRGLEALTLSVPPTPGRSIIKRPNNENLFSIGQIFRARGYDTRFTYGGYGYFDNMNYFFKHNGFEILDRTDMDDKEIQFANIWGVSDEDLFNRALKDMDQSYHRGKKFFNFIMTTSNHRPFTYPEGRIDIPSHTSREGGVKYTDYAIGRFIKQARQKPWFKNSVFVIVADHCASSAGEAELQFNKYLIPLLIYSPAHIRPKTVSTLASQIDVAPTLLGLLNFSYDSKFYGRDIFHTRPDEERAFIGNYQKLGYMKNGRLTILSPQKKVSAYRVDFKKSTTTPITPDANDLAEAITYYQSANIAFKKRLNLWSKPESTHTDD
ncbi:Sulfatase family protein [hydrothermal vent metagenome]|uniref:Sulfatase family protein n=1 Tax=hydrothermal vent metagenome TaxID=652676 RepID=A0A3B1BT28_9ZZZZ